MSRWAARWREALPGVRPVTGTVRAIGRTGRAKGLGGVLTFPSNIFRRVARSRARSGVLILIGLLALDEPLPGGGSLARAALAKAEDAAGRALGNGGLAGRGGGGRGATLVEAAAVG